MTPDDELQDNTLADRPTGMSAQMRPRRKSRSAPAQLDFPLVRNGLDYLASVVDHLGKNESMVTEQDVKYAVLHLHAAVEVLLKARLLSEHWSLVFSEPHQATRKALDEATLSSVSIDHAVTRLQNIALVRISDKEKLALKHLKEDRNQLQHFGMTAPAPVIETRAGEVLDFLIHFVDHELLPHLSDREKIEARLVLRRLRGGLASIKVFVRKRTNRIRGEVTTAGAENRTIGCPECGYTALVLGEAAGPDGEPVSATCRFCTTLWEQKELLYCFPADDRGELSELNTCPQCREWTLGWGVRVFSNPDKGVPFCFACSVAFPSFVPCDRCSRPIDHADDSDQALCGRCWDNAVEEDRYGLEEPMDYDDEEQG
ncbi:DNA-directed RNA polymerase subunit RPC12/RpoP [Streptomyces umbrinus]|uniref:DNA-directed RNA polymerase subunit RPC12/RpoP n=1 Tax=Streptomyces umbrinus TaxID=67370 RepID=A0ABU0T8L2_9ACTN|nr:serine/arginine repetitive matrix protein 1 [Streptomyces umbrinus]MDQ1031316.1 DNA-directed RNA polymerase subunit RPC12/RpoP [Streptomyces umbrinus]